MPLVKKSRSRAVDEASDHLSLVLKHLRLTREEWGSINEKRQDQLFVQAEKEMRRIEKKKTKDTLTPVGAEDPERAVALKKHEEGITRSQDVTKRARDIQGHEIREKLGISEAEWAKLDKSARQDKAREALARGKDEVMPVGDAQMTEYEQGLRKHIANLKKEPQSAMRDRLIRTAQLAIEKGITREDAARLIAKAKDTELPTAVKTSNLVPMPSGERNEVSYAPRRIAARDRGRFKKVGDGDRDRTVGSLNSELAGLEATLKDARTQGKPQYGGNTREIEERIKDIKYELSQRKRATDGVDRYEVMEGPGGFEVWVNGLLEATKPTQQTAIAWAKADGAYSDTIKVTRMNDAKRTGDAKAVMPLQASGSEPADHMRRAAEYEIAGDRARALDSYRAAASGYRKANDRANEAKARDGVEACQAKFSTQYQHPGAGRVKVCDSAEQAMRTAVERTRAGESVRVDGKTVRPGRARDSSIPQEERKWGWSVSDPSGQIIKGERPIIKATTREAAFEKVRSNKPAGGHVKVFLLQGGAHDEHEGFQKLEKSLSHEKGVANPAALAASIGRKKYGEKGMEAKSAAGRARDFSSKPKSEADAVECVSSEARVSFQEARNALRIARGNDWAAKVTWAIEFLENHATDSRREVQPV